MHIDESWRRDWEMQEQCKPMPRAWHRSGLCFLFEFQQIDQVGKWGWAVLDDDVSESRLKELREEMGEGFATFWDDLGYQAKVLWRELGYSDDSATPRR